MTTVDTMVAESVLVIAQDLFTAMIDGEPGHLDLGTGGTALVSPVYAWVDIQGGRTQRALVATDRAAAEQITRSLLAMHGDDPVSLEDVEDALGEVANVVGGNLKGLAPEASVLTIPVVSVEAPSESDGSAWLLPLQWREHPLYISLQYLNENGEDPCES